LIVQKTNALQRVYHRIQKGVVKVVLLKKREGSQGRWKSQVGEGRFGQAQKKRGARLRRVGFPVYNLMKSFESRINVFAASFFIAAVSFH